MEVLLCMIERQSVVTAGTITTIQYMLNIYDIHRRCTLVTSTVDAPQFSFGVVVYGQATQ